MSLSNPQIDTDNLFSFYDYCKDNNLFCDLYINAAKSHFQVLQAIATCGRGGITLAGGKLAVIFDQGSAGTDVISRENVLDKSYNIQYIGQRATAGRNSGPVRRPGGGLRDKGNPEKSSRKVRHEHIHGHLARSHPPQPGHTGAERADREADIP